MFKRMGIFKTIVISYLVFLLIPLTAFTVYLTNYVGKTYQQDIMSSQNASLTQSMDLLDLRLAECQRIALQLSKHEFFSKAAISKRSAYNISQAITILKLVKGGNEFLGEIGLYYYGDNSMITSSGVMEKQIINESFGLQTDEIELFWEKLTENRQNGAHLERIRENWLLSYVVSVPYNYPCSNGSVVFMLDYAAINGLFLPRTENNQRIQLLVQTDGTILFGKDGLKELPDDIIAKAIDSKRIIMDGKVFFTQSVQSSIVTNMHMILLTPCAALAPSIQTYLVPIIMVSAILVFCIILATRFAMRTWKPICELGSMVLPQDNMKSLRWEPLKNAMQDTLARKMQIENTLEDYYQIMRENLLLRLIHGKNVSDTCFNEEMHRLGLPEDCNRASILAVMLPNAQYVEIAMCFLERYSNCICAVETGAINCMIIGVFLSRGEDEKMVSQIAENIANEMKRENSTKCSIGIGRVVAFDQIKWSYLQACAVLNECSEQAFSIKSIRAASTGVDNLPELREKEMIFALALSQGNQELALQMFDESVTFTIQNAPAMYRFVCYGFLNRILKACDECEFDKERAEQIKKQYGELAGRIEEVGNGAVIQQMRQAIREICIQIECVSRLREDKYTRSIEEFIRANYSEKSFSLDTLADEFGSTPAYWGRMVKEKLGVSFLDFVWQLRLAHAKQLLEQTELTVQEVVEAVGYIDARSFIRKFKNSEGITPGQYKSLNANRKE